MSEVALNAVTCNRELIILALQKLSKLSIAPSFLISDLGRFHLAHVC